MNVHIFWAAKIIAYNTFRNFGTSDHLQTYRKWNTFQLFYELYREGNMKCKIFKMRVFELRVFEIRVLKCENLKWRYELRWLYSAHISWVCRWQVLSYIIGIRGRRLICKVCFSAFFCTKNHVKILKTCENRLTWKLEKNEKKIFSTKKMKFFQIFASTQKTFQFFPIFK